MKSRDYNVIITVIVEMRDRMVHIRPDNQPMRNYLKASPCPPHARFGMHVEIDNNIIYVCMYTMHMYEVREISIAEYCFLSFFKEISRPGKPHLSIHTILFFLFSVPLTDKKVHIENP